MSTSVDFIDQLKDRLDLPSLISDEGVALKQSGKYWKACCPFHEEKTPSFVVSEIRSGWRWHCYGGCGGGDALDFLMKHRGFSFRDALEHAAAHAGLEIPKQHTTPEQAKKRETAKRRREAILLALEFAAGWFVEQLATEAGKPAKGEIVRRGFSKMAEPFRLGFAPDKGLIGALHDAKIKPAVAVEAGLLGKREQGGGVYERFRNRLMFPVTDRQGRVVGFSGRYLGEESKTIPKYTNTKEIPGVFEKGRLLFALDSAWRSIRTTGKVILVEGHADAVALHAKGYTNAVATMGTALTEDHLVILQSLDAEVLMLMDGDEAGRKATWSAAPALAGSEIPARAFMLPEGEDPDSWLRKGNDLPDTAPELFPLWLEQLAKINQSPMAISKAFRNEVVPVLAGVSETTFELYLPDIKKALGIPAKTARLECAAHKTREVEKSAKKPTSKPSSPRPPSDDDEPEFGAVLMRPDGCIHVVKANRKGDTYTKVVMEGHIIPKKRIRLGSDGEILKADLVNPRRKIKVPVDLSPAVWASRRSFKEAMPTMDFGWIGTDDELVQVMIHLSRKDVPIVKGTRVLGIHLIEGKWAFVASDKTYLAGGGESTEMIHYADGETGVSYDTTLVEEPSQDDFRLFSEASLQFSAPRNVASILGWLGAAVFKERLAHVLKKKDFPFLLIWGERGSGKSQYLEHVVLEFLSAGQVRMSPLSGLKTFPAILTSSLSNLIPFPIDEYKGAESKTREHRMIVSDTIRNCYNVLAGKRGRKSGMHQRLYPAVAPLVVAGEDSITEPAAQERMVEVFLSKKARESREPWWLDLLKSDRGALGLDFIRWSLNLDDELVEQEFKAVLDDEVLIRPIFKDRIRHNVAVAIFGLRMMARWLEERGYGWPSDSMEEFEEALVEEQIHCRFPSLAGKNKSLVDRLLEFMSAAAANNIIKEDMGRDYTVQSWKGHKEVLAIRLFKVYPLITEWQRRTGVEVEIINKDAFEAQVRQEPYFLASNKAMRHVGLGQEGRQYRSLVLDLEKMRELGIDMEGFTIEAAEDDDDE